MLWIFLAVLAYFLDALVFIVDKYLLSDDFPYPNSYAFWVAILNLFILLLFPLGIRPLSGLDLIIALISGISFFFGLLFLYHAIKEAHVTEVMPAIGALTAIGTFGLSFWILPKPFTMQELIAFCLLVGGTLLMSYVHLTNKKLIGYILASALGQSVSYVTLKYIFNVTDFVNGLFWTRLGLIVAALCLLFISSQRQEIKTTLKNQNLGTKTLFLTNKILAAGAFALLYYAIKIGDVVFINAIQGVQYVFIFIVGFMLISLFPALFKEHGHGFKVRKGIATAVIIVGLVLLFTV